MCTMGRVDPSASRRASPHAHIAATTIDSAAKQPSIVVSLRVMIDLRVQKREMEDVRCQSADTRFPRAHESDQREIADLAGVFHAYEVVD